MQAMDHGCTSNAHEHRCRSQSPFGSMYTWMFHEHAALAPADFLANRVMDNHNDETIIFDKGVQLLTEHVLSQSDFFLHTLILMEVIDLTLCQAAAEVRIEVCRTNGMHTHHSM